MEVSVNSFKTNEEAIEAASISINRLLEEYQDSQILFLVSAGSAFSLLEEVKEDLLGPHITVSVLDERFLSDPKVNNFLQLKSLKFYKKAQKSGCSFIPTCFSPDKSLEDAAEFFSHELRGWKTKYPDGKIIATQGIGDDGHTSGIMPFPEDEEQFRKLFEGERWVAGYNAEGKNPYPLRVTTTITFLRNYIDNAVLFISGESKREIFKKLLKRELKVYEMPAQIIWEMKDVEVFTNLN